jgi:hypothetical protein
MGNSPEGIGDWLVILTGLWQKAKVLVVLVFGAVLPTIPYVTMKRLSLLTLSLLTLATGRLEGR